MIITAKHIKQAGYCINSGARHFCERHGIDFRRLVREGIPEEELAGIDDAMMRRVIEVAHGK